jgi:hypothetical protein
MQGNQPLVLQINWLPCNCGATARHVIYDGQWRGSDRSPLGHSGPSLSVIGLQAPLTVGTDVDERAQLTLINQTLRRELPIIVLVVPPTTPREVLGIDAQAVIRQPILEITFFPTAANFGPEPKEPNTAPSILRYQGAEMGLSLRTH